jgi:uncharacterized protein
MSIQEELKAELKDAMRSRDQNRLDVVRAVESEIKLARTAPGFQGEVDDALYLQIIGTYCKKMDKARLEYEGLGERGKPLAQKLAFEVSYLGRWLPKKLGEDETRALVEQAVAELGITDPKQMGKLVGHLMKTRKDDLDGALVNRIAREVLSG